MAPSVPRGLLLGPSWGLRPSVQAGRCGGTQRRPPPPAGPGDGAPGKALSEKPPVPGALRAPLLSSVLPENARLQRPLRPRSARGVRGPARRPRSSQPPAPQAPHRGPPTPCHLPQPLSRALAHAPSGPPAPAAPSAGPSRVGRAPPTSLPSVHPPSRSREERPIHRGCTGLTAPCSVAASAPSAGPGPQGWPEPQCGHGGPGLGRPSGSTLTLRHPALVAPVAS